MTKTEAALTTCLCCLEAIRVATNEFGETLYVTADGTESCPDPLQPGERFPHEPANGEYIALMDS